MIKREPGDLRQTILVFFALPSGASGGRAENHGLTQLM
jgi:hypothetical protein